MLEIIGWGSGKTEHTRQTKGRTDGTEKIPVAAGSEISATLIRSPREVNANPRIPTLPNMMPGGSGRGQFNEASRHSPVPPETETDTLVHYDQY